MLEAECKIDKCNAWAQTFTGNHQCRIVTAEHPQNLEAAAMNCHQFNTTCLVTICWGALSACGAQGWTILNKKVLHAVRVVATQQRWAGQHAICRMHLMAQRALAPWPAVRVRRQDLSP